ncbi:MAG TPA: hydrogenase maturation protease [Bryobacteraceae bacterium]|nr:hydrogenase maturation protease [Bryobacteraceae bacterium]
MKILVACIGNIFLGDDGFGVEVARKLAQRKLPENVVVKDFGIRGLDLAYALLDPYDLAILVDACPLGGAPGTVYVIEPEAAAGAAAIDPHSMHPMNVLRTAKAMGGASCPVLIVGCEPADLGPEQGKMGLSETVEAALEEAAGVVESLIERAGRGELVAAVR